jgi:lipopolysaccharide/colanic/teichoic acid biosynthesis glycosyltransferase
MKSIEAILLVIGLLILSALLLAIPTMLLWNALLPHLFDTPRIGLYEAVGINILSGILFKSNVNIKKD